MVPDDFEASAPAINAPYRHAAAITPSDSADLPICTRALLAAAAGTVIVRMKRSTAPVTLAIAAGVPLPVRVDRVLTGGTATGLVALW